MKELAGLQGEVLSDEQFVDRVKEALEADDRVVLAYAMGTWENVDQRWPELEAVLNQVRS